MLPRLNKILALYFIPFFPFLDRCASWSDHPHDLIILIIPPAIPPPTATCLFQLKTLSGFLAPHFDTLVQRFQWQQGKQNHNIRDVCNKTVAVLKVFLTLSERLLEKDRAQDKTLMNKNRREYFWTRKFLHKDHWEVFLVNNDVAFRIEPEINSTSRNLRKMEIKASFTSRNLPDRRTVMPQGKGSSC